MGISNSLEDAGGSFPSAGDTLIGIGDALGDTLGDALSDTLASAGDTLAITFEDVADTFEGTGIADTFFLSLEILFLRSMAHICFIFNLNFI